MVSAGVVSCALRSPTGPGPRSHAAPHPNETRAHKDCQTNPRDRRGRRTRRAQQAFKPMRTNEPEPCSESKRTRASYWNRCWSRSPAIRG
jgi:hypothetical protein